MRPEEMQRHTVVFNFRAQPNTSGELLSVVRRPATIERLSVWFPLGSGAMLKLWPEIWTVDNEVVPLPNYARDGSIQGYDYFIGDDVTYNLIMSKQINEGDRLRVRYQNSEAGGGPTHDFIVLMDVDFAGGRLRAGVVNG